MDGECEPTGGMICRRFYPGDSACTMFGGKAMCLEQATKAAIDYDHNKPDFRHDETYNLRRPRRR